MNAAVPGSVDERRGNYDDRARNSPASALREAVQQETP